MSNYLIRTIRPVTFLSKRNYSEVVNVFGRRTVDTRGDPEKKGVEVGAKLPENKELVTPLIDQPIVNSHDKSVNIYVSAKNSMQSGTDKLKKWKVEFNSKERWENHLMGWGSSGDAMSNTQLEFPSKEDAIIYCQRQGLEFTIREPQEMNKRIKSYGANFSWDKKTRRSTK